MSKILNKLVFALVVLTIVISLTNFVNVIISCAIYLLTIILIIVQKGFKLFKLKSLIMLNIFYIISLFYSFFGHGAISLLNYKSSLYEIILIYTAYFMSVYLIHSKVEDFKKLLLLSLGALTISLGVSQFIAIINPMALRDSFSDIDSYRLVEGNVYSSFGLLTYPQAHSLSVVSIALCVLFCFSKTYLIRIISIILWIATNKLLFDMTITTALLISVFCCVPLLILKISNGNIIFCAIMYIFLAIIFFSGGIILKFLDFADSSNSQIFAKLNDFYSSLLTGSAQGQVEGRNNLYYTSLKTFLSNPIFGWGKDNGSRMFIGEHSFLFDYLAYYGLIALLFFSSWWKHFKMCIPNRFRRYRYISIYCFIPVILLISTKSNTVCTFMPFASLVFLQIVISYISFEDNKNVMNMSTSCNANVRIIKK